MALPQNIYHELIVLIEHSRVMTDRQKEMLHKKISELSDRNLYKLVEILKEEQRILAEHYHQTTQINKRAAEKHIKAIYHATEQMVEIVEKNEINSLEDELEALES